MIHAKQGKAGLLATAGLVSLMALGGIAQAQTAQPAQPQVQAAPKATAPGTAANARANAGLTTTQRVEERISALHQELAIQPQQEKQWSAVSSAMRDNARSMEDAMEQRREAWTKMSAIEDLKSYQKIAEVHSQGLDKMIDAFTPLYQSMTPEQKAAADKVFHTYNNRAAQAGVPTKQQGGTTE